MKVLILDNYDSFSYNLYQLIGSITGIRPVVVRNDAIDVAGIREQRPDVLVISPGPGSPDVPEYFGVCRAAILELGDELPILGVCLGHQGIVSAFGGCIRRAESVMHGKTSMVFHARDALFDGIPSEFEAMRYHSLLAERSSMPSCLESIAWTADGTIMAVRHRARRTFGVQFHPESIGTAVGARLVKNFLDSKSS